MGNLRATEDMRNVLAQGIANKINAGAGPGAIRFYTGDQPMNADELLVDQTLLGTVSFSDPCEESIRNGVLVFAEMAMAERAEGTGQAGWARIEDSERNNVFDCDVGEEGSGATIEMNTVDIVKGGPIHFTSFSITIPAG